MHLEKYKADKIKTVKQYADLFKIEFEHELKETKASVEWSGPPIPKEEWHAVMSFFRWTNDTTHSESQVRLFVNPLTKTWKAWAFPQEANTGMSARELQTDDAKAQRAQFPDSEGWLYFGTIHHHCSMSAFQSGTDQHNEENQDGIHITIGYLNSDKHDIHARFYINGCKFKPDLSLFWDVGDLVRDSLPRQFWGPAAEHQMSQKVEMAFPDQWKTNLIHKVYEPNRTTGFFGYPGGSGNGSSGGLVVTDSHSHRTYVGGGSSAGEWKRNAPLWQRKGWAIRELFADIKQQELNVDEIWGLIEEMSTDTTGIFTAITSIMRDYDIDAMDISAEWEDQIEAQERLSRVEGLPQGTPPDPKTTTTTQKDEPKNEAQNNGVPDYMPPGVWPDEISD